MQPLYSSTVNGLSRVEGHAVTVIISRLNVWQRTMLTAQRPQVPFQLNRLTLAIIIHASYNALATLLELAGVFQ